jgi:AbrB family looped-hinge helix DNA binding protein
MNPITISKRGQITILTHYRAKYGLKPGTRLSIVDYAGGLSLYPVPRDPIHAAHGILKGGKSLTRVLLKEHREERVRKR